MNLSLELDDKKITTVILFNCFILSTETHPGKINFEDLENLSYLECVIKVLTTCQD